MLDASTILLSRPRPPARNSLPTQQQLTQHQQQQQQQQQLQQHQHHHQHHQHQHQREYDQPEENIHHQLPIPPQLISTSTELTESPLSQVAKLLQGRKPGAVEFKSSRSFIEAWSYNNPDPTHQTHQGLEEQQDQDLDLESELRDLDSNHLLQRDLDNELDQNSITHEWVSAKTREELESLLLAADRVIKERERDLGIAASIGKSLLENNIALRARQEKLLAHISATSLPSSPTNRPFEDLVNRSEYIEARPPSSPNESELRNTHLQVSLDLTPSPNHKHQEFKQATSNRSTLFPYCLRSENSPHSSLSSISSDRVKNPRNSSDPCQPATSATPNTLHRLTQQNEYLAQQLADLQTETAESELEGRKRLRKLVKELETLRADLRQAEERNALLEEERFPQFEQQNNNVGHMVEEIVGDMKRVILDDHELMVKMYTPAKSTASITRDINLPHQQQSTPIIPMANSSSSFSQSSPSFLSTASKRSSVSNHSRASLEYQSSPQERALVSQLLGKIAELKESQTEFEQEREEMKMKLQRAREEVQDLQHLVEEAESELQQVRQLGWEGHRGLIEWEDQGENNSKIQAVPSSRASGNRKMINQSRKAKKRQWPAPEYHPGSIGSDTVFPESNASSNFGCADPVSPSLRGQALSRARRNPNHTDHLPENLILHSDSGIMADDSTTSSFWVNAHDNGGEREMKSSKQVPPLRTLLSEMNSLSPDQSNVENNIFNTIWSDPSHEHHSKSPVVPINVPTDKKSVSTATSGSSKRTTQATYTELQREVAETPLRWADENVDDQSHQSTRSDGKPRRLSNSRKRDSTNWLYRIPSSGSTSHYMESWNTARFATIGLTSHSKHEPKTDSFVRDSQFLIQGDHPEQEQLFGHLHPSHEDGQPSTTCSLITIGKLSPSHDLALQEPTQIENARAVSRQEEALKRLGISSLTDVDRDGHLRGELGTGQDALGAMDSSRKDSNEEEEEEEEEEVEGWNCIDSIDLDSTDYCPVSIQGRHSPRMIVNRLQAKGTGWGTFVYQWMKLVSVVGLAVGWAVWQGPRSALEDESLGFHNDNDNHTPHKKQRLAIEHRPSGSFYNKSRDNHNSKSSLESGSSTS